MGAEGVWSSWEGTESIKGAVRPPVTRSPHDHFPQLGKMRKRFCRQTLQCQMHELVCQARFSNSACLSFPICDVGASPRRHRVLGAAHVTCGVILLLVPRFGQSGLQATFHPMTQLFFPHF